MPAAKQPDDTGPVAANDRYPGTVPGSGAARVDDPVGGAMTSQLAMERDYLTKISLNLPNETVGLLRSLAARQQTTMTEIIRQGIVLQSFIADEVDAGGKLLIEDAAGRFKRVVLPWTITRGQAR